MEEKKYYIRDIETGWPTEVSKEQWELYQQLLECYRPKLSDNFKGKVIIFGTGGDLEGGDNFKQLFYNNDFRTGNDSI